MRTPHSSTRQGKRVKVTLRNGEIYIGKFKDKKSGTIILSDMRAFDPMMGVSASTSGKCTRISMKEVRAFSIYKPIEKPLDWQNQ